MRFVHVTLCLFDVAQLPVYGLHPATRLSTPSLRHLLWLQLLQQIMMQPISAR